MKNNLIIINTLIRCIPVYKDIVRNMQSEPTRSPKVVSSDKPIIDRGYDTDEEEYKNIMKDYEKTNKKQVESTAQSSISEKENTSRSSEESTINIQTGKQENIQVPLEKLMCEATEKSPRNL
jgi:hypothetical protein